MNISAEKLSYLKGVIDGMNLSEKTSEGKLFLGIIDVLSALSSEKEQLESRVDKLGEYVDDLDESLSDLSDTVYESDDDTDNYDSNDSDDDFDRDDNDDTDDNFDRDDNDDTDDDEFDDSDNGVTYYSAVCPYCHSYVTLTGDLLPEKGEGFECPACGKLLFRK